jgi:hypothetical protein
MWNNHAGWTLGGKGLFDIDPDIMHVDIIPGQPVCIFWKKLVLYHGGMGYKYIMKSKRPLMYAEFLYDYIKYKVR